MLRYLTGYHTDKKLQLSDLTEITLTPHKISQNNGGDYPTHIDCTIDIKCNIAYTVKYHVQEPGETGYSNVYNESKAIVNGTPDTIVEHNYAQTKTVDGITYEFDGWYNEANEASKANKVETWPYAPNETELADGTVNFYARYIPQLTTMTIKKEFSGLVGNDVTKPEITVTVTGDDGFTITKVGTVLSARGRVLTARLDTELHNGDGLGFFATLWKVLTN